MVGPRSPAAAGVRLDWSGIPQRVRAAVEDWLGSPVVSAASQSAGFSPGAAVRLRTSDGRRVFVKAVVIFGSRAIPDVIHYPDRGEILYAFEDGTWRLQRTDGTLIKEGRDP